MKHKIVNLGVCLLMLLPVLPLATAMDPQTSSYPNNTTVPSPTLDSTRITIKIVAAVYKIQDTYNLLGGVIHLNDTMTGKYVYDTSVADSEPDPHYGSYIYTSSPYGFEVKTGNFDFKSDPNNVYFAIGLINDWSVYGSPPVDEFSLGSLNNLPLSNGLIVTSLEWNLADSTATALSSDALPSTAPVLADWNGGQGVFIEGHASSAPSHTFRIFAHVTEATKHNAITRGVSSERASTGKAFMFGRIVNKTTYGDIVLFNAVKTRVLTFHPRNFKTYSYVKFAVSALYVGFIGKHVMYALCDIKTITYIDLIAENNAFDVGAIIVDADDTVVINFMNNDAGVPHNFALYTNSSAAHPLYQGDIITGVSSITYVFLAPATKGTYFFRDDAHPATMYGNFIVM